MHIFKQPGEGNRHIWARWAAEWNGQWETGLGRERGGHPPSPSRREENTGGPGWPENWVPTAISGQAFSRNPSLPQTLLPGLASGSLIISGRSGGADSCRCCPLQHTHTSPVRRVYGQHSCSPRCILRKVPGLLGRLMGSHLQKLSFLEKNPKPLD